MAMEWLSTSQPCRAKGCRAPAVGKDGYCIPHYAEHVAPMPWKLCNVPGCRKKIHAHRLCRSHYRRM